MQNNKITSPKFVDWPPIGFGKFLGAQRVAGKYQIADRCFREICTIFPEFKEFWNDLFALLPPDDLPLLIGRTLPAFVTAAIEDRFKAPGLGREISKGFMGHMTNAMDDYYTHLKMFDLWSAVEDSWKQ